MQIGAGGVIFEIDEVCAARIKVGAVGIDATCAAWRNRVICRSSATLPFAVGALQRDQVQNHGRLRKRICCTRWVDIVIGHDGKIFLIHVTGAFYLKAQFFKAHCACQTIICGEGGDAVYIGTMGMR